MASKENEPTIWFRESARLWWKSRRARSQPYREYFESRSWRYLFIHAGVHPVLMVRPEPRTRA